MRPGVRCSSSHFKGNRHHVIGSVPILRFTRVACGSRSSDVWQSVTRLNIRILFWSAYQGPNLPQGMHFCDCLEFPSLSSVMRIRLCDCGRDRILQICSTQRQHGECRAVPTVEILMSLILTAQTLQRRQETSEVTYHHCEVLLQLILRCTERFPSSNFRE